VHNQQEHEEETRQGGDPALAAAGQEAALGGQEAARGPAAALDAPREVGLLGG